MRTVFQVQRISFSSVLLTTLAVLVEQSVLCVFLCLEIAFERNDF